VLGAWATMLTYKARESDRVGRWLGSRGAAEMARITAFQIIATEGLRKVRLSLVTRWPSSERACSTINANGWRCGRANTVARPKKRPLGEGLQQHLPSSLEAERLSPVSCQIISRGLT
jgi:hypothetical protein